ncbi:unnamed protein product [marine sediment metagenome]|uniref:Uncharacterized protein n=1 Tax=marine sediment metagenome TaxID=412755 RepID=X1PCU2_9ZZZZ
MIEIALNTPEALSLLEKESQYETSVNWVAINWLKNGMAICGFDYECVDKGIPATVPESAEFYSQVEIYIGEPAYYPKYLLRVAINPDTGEVAHVQQHGWVSDCWNRCPQEETCSSSQDTGCIHTS